MGINKAGTEFVGMKVATQHGYDLHGILETINIDEVQVFVVGEVPNQVCLDHSGYHQRVAKA